MNAPKYIDNAIAEYGIHKKNIIKGIPDKPFEYDKLTVIMICLNSELPVEEKKRILLEDYGIAMTREKEEDMNTE